jgi:type I restriction enzyme M protein
VYGDNADGTSERTAGEWSFTTGEQTAENSRWQCFSRDYIRTTKGDSLDISWLKDNDSVDAANLPEPDVLAAEAMSELTEALRELDGLMQALGAGDQANTQKQLLAEVLGIGAMDMDEKRKYFPVVEMETIEQRPKYTGKSVSLEDMDAAIEYEASKAR